MTVDVKELTLLCVEDNKTSQLIYEASLEDKVKRIIFADDGAQGYEKFQTNDVDIIFSDYDMPILNGLEMIKKIREENKEIPIVLISAIDDLSVMIRALQMNINNFVQKPLVSEEIVAALNSAAKLIIANNVLKEERDRKLQLLQDKHTYTSYQEELSFAKELNILRNDFYYQMIKGKEIVLVDFLYQPLDVVSGDAYSARRIDENRTFYLIVDGMGKGFSASLTAMIITSFINHIIDKMIEFESFSFDMLIRESMDYIKPILLDEEALAIDYIFFDSAYNKLQYAKFAMPASLMQDSNDEIIKIKSNNPPLSKWQEGFKVGEYDIADIDKFLFFSDGIVENSMKDSDEPYSSQIESDFKNSFSKEEFKSKLLNSIEHQEDDLTLLFINKLKLDDTLVARDTFHSNLESLDVADEWYTEVIETLLDDTKLAYSMNLTFTELFMNAFEHGNLGLTAQQKHKLLEEDEYFETLNTLSEKCTKKTTVSVYKVNNLSSSYIITKIHDEGEGFDTQMLSEIFRNSRKFNGRGVFVSRKNSMGIYYNTQGNCVLYLNKI